jgi:hypothetical protein
VAEDAADKGAGFTGALRLRFDDAFEELGVCVNCRSKSAT